MFKPLLSFFLLSFLFMPRLAMAASPTPTTSRLDIVLGQTKHHISAIMAYHFQSPLKTPFTVKLPYLSRNAVVLTPPKTNISSGKITVPTGATDLIVKLQLPGHNPALLQFITAMAITKAYLYAEQGIHPSGLAESSLFHYQGFKVIQNQKLREFTSNTIAANTPITWPIATASSPLPAWFEAMTMTFFGLFMLSVGIIAFRYRKRELLQNKNLFVNRVPD